MANASSVTDSIFGDGPNAEAERPADEPTSSAGSSSKNTTQTRKRRRPASSGKCSSGGERERDFMIFRVGRLVGVLVRLRGHSKTSVLKTKAPRGLGFFALYSGGENLIAHSAKKNFIFSPILQ